MSTARLVNGSVVLSGALPLGATNSGRLNSQAFGAQDVQVNVFVTAVAGTTPGLIVKLQDSADGTTWGDVATAATASLTAAGSATFFARSAKQFQRVVGTVTGSATPTVTATVAVLVFAEV